MLLMALASLISFSGVLGTPPSAAGTIQQKAEVLSAVHAVQPEFTIGDILLTGWQDFSGLTVDIGGGQKVVIDDLRLGTNQRGGLCPAFLQGRTLDGKDCVFDTRQRCARVFDDFESVGGFTLHSEPSGEVYFVESIYFGINLNGDLSITGLTGTRENGSRIEALPDLLAFTPHCGDQVPTSVCRPTAIDPCGGQTSQCTTTGPCQCLVGSGFCEQVWSITCPGDSDCPTGKFCRPSGGGGFLTCACQ
jgi:hypothetical protein